MYFSLSVLISSVMLPSTTLLPFTLITASGSFAVKSNGRLLTASVFTTVDEYPSVISTVSPFTLKSVSAVVDLRIIVTEYLCFALESFPVSTITVVTGLEIATVLPPCTLTFVPSYSGVAFITTSSTLLST